MELTEKVAYLKGLMEGLGIDDGSKEGKMFNAIVDLLDDMALSVADMEDSMDCLCEQVDLIDEDLEELVEDFYEFDDMDDDDDFDGELYEITCPTCHDTICIDEEMLDEGEMNCPNCGESLEFDLDGVLEECGCGCEEHHENHKKEK